MLDINMIITNSFKEFTDGYDIVVTEIGKRKTLKPMLSLAQVNYPMPT
jgi:hypothetical protein